MTLGEWAIVILFFIPLTVLAVVFFVLVTWLQVQEETAK